MHGKQQQRAIPIKHAKTTQKIAKKTSNARKTTDNLHNCRIRIMQLSSAEVLMHCANRTHIHVHHEHRICGSTDNAKERNLFSVSISLSLIDGLWKIKSEILAYFRKLRD